MSLSENTNTWQNLLLRLAFLLTCVGSFVTLVFIIMVFFNADVGNAGAVASPLMLCCLVGIMALLVGVAMERETVKERLPRVSKKMLIGSVVFLAIVFGVKSFLFGLGMMSVLVLSVFLFKTYDAQMRAVAVCGGLVCLGIAEAIRRAGGYDSGGAARMMLMGYSFSAFLFPGLLMISSRGKHPKVLSIGCAGFAVLTVHSSTMLLSGMSSVMDNIFTGKSMGGENEYCIMSTISSPVGLVVEAFQAAMFPPYVYEAPATTTPQMRPSTTVTTTVDCLSWVSAEHFYEDENSTNSTNGSQTQLIRSMDGVDLSHCVEVMEMYHFDPNSTTTTGTTTTSTSTTSTSTTSTTTTSTTSTTTTSTTTSTTSTSTSTTSTTTSTVTTSFNGTETETTTVFVSTTSVMPVYVMTENGVYCPPGNDIHQEPVCRAAASALGKIYGRTWNGAGEHRACSYADDNREKVYFNHAAMPSPRPYENFASLCYRVSPDTTLDLCAPGTAATKVSGAGMWAIAIFFLSSVWVTALCFVLIMFVGHHHHHHQVHPEPGEEGVSDDPYGLAAFKHQQSEAASGATKCKKFCKKLVMLIVTSMEMAIGAAIFVISGIALAATGLVQLPQKRPYCAKEPRWAPFAWAEEPVERIAVTYCESGAIASVAFSFLAFCVFLLAFSMSYEKVHKYHVEDTKKKEHKHMLKMTQRAQETGEAVEEGPDYGEGFRVGKMIAQEPAPLAMWADYDGRIFDV